MTFSRNTWSGTRKTEGLLRVIHSGITLCTCKRLSVVLGDNNVECYEVFMTMMKEVHATLLPLSVDKDGLGLAEQEKQQLLVASAPEGSIQANAGEDADNGDGDSNCSGVRVHQKKTTEGETNDKSRQSSL